MEEGNLEKRLRRESLATARLLAITRSLIYDDVAARGRSAEADSLIKRLDAEISENCKVARAMGKAGRDR